MELRERRPNKWWTESDTFAMLTLIQQLDLVHELDKKRQRNHSHFRRLHGDLAQRDIHFTVNQIRNRWKSLKHKYRKIKTAGYRSPAARLAAIESFRYFRLLDRMLARKARVSGSVAAPEPAPAEGRSMVERPPSDPEDHTDDRSGEFVPPWQSSLAPPLCDDDDPQTSAEEGPASPRAPGWGVHHPEESWGEAGLEDLSLGVPRWAEQGSEEVMTLGESGEYLFPVKTEPETRPCLAGREGSDDHVTCSPGPHSGSCEDSPSLVLQQLSLLNQQVAMQRAEQRAFHCSLLDLLDRQTRLLEQLTSCSSDRPTRPNTDRSTGVYTAQHTKHSPDNPTDRPNTRQVKSDPDQSVSVIRRQTAPSPQSSSTPVLQTDPLSQAEPLASQIDPPLQAEPASQTDPSSMVLQVHSALVQILRGVEQVQTQRQQPCSCKTSPSQPPSLVPSPSQPSSKASPSRPTSPSKPPSEPSSQSSS